MATLNVLRDGRKKPDAIVALSLYFTWYFFTHTKFDWTRLARQVSDDGRLRGGANLAHGRAAELLFTGRPMSAEEGTSWGFFSPMRSITSQGTATTHWSRFPV